MITDIKKLVVKYNDKTVGYLAQLDEGIAFQYDEKWLKNGFNISPFSLPLEDRVFINRKDIFNVFYGNKDDHGKNFAFLFDEKLDGYKLSPFYDITARPIKLSMK